MSVSVFIIAGEPSGDRLGAALMAGLKTVLPDGVRFEGVGGPLMENEGLESLVPMAELSVMGVFEVLPRLRHLMRRIREVADQVLTRRPDVLITIDSPDFCLRVARRVKAKSAIRTVHYVAPTVWAWREGRSEKMARVIDHVLALLPFEPPYMRAAGMRCDFVGHPVVAETWPNRGQVDMFRLAHRLEKSQPVIAALPGSRRGEVRRLAPIIGAALEPVLARHPNARVIVPTTANVADDVISATSDWPGKPVVLDPRDQDASQAEMQKRAALSAADVALAVSGTVSLELAAADTPMVIAYDVNWLTRKIAERLIKVDTYTLVNLVSETRAVPEYVGIDCKPLLIGKALNRLIEDPAAQERQRDAMDLTMERLGYGEQPPGLRAALAVLDGLQATDRTRAPNS